MKMGARKTDERTKMTVEITTKENKIIEMNKNENIFKKKHKFAKHLVGLWEKRKH